VADSLESGYSIVSSFRSRHLLAGSRDTHRYAVNSARPRRRTAPLLKGRILYRLVNGLSVMLTVVAALAGPNEAIAQFSIGASGGLFRANLWGDKLSSSAYKSVFTLSGSAVLEYWVSSEISLTIQPGFVKGGSNIGYKPPLGLGEVVDSAYVRLNYLSVPVLARIVTKGAFYVTTGPVFGRLVDAKGWLEGEDEREDLSDHFESDDLGFVFGVGKLIPKGRFNTFVEFRIVWGFSNVAATSSGRTRVRTSGQQLIVGAQYNLGG